jgi:hypothetical protein
MDAYWIIYRGTVGDERFNNKAEAKREFAEICKREPRSMVKLYRCEMIQEQRGKKLHEP